MSFADKILGQKGLIAERLGNYEARPQQLDMARAVAAAIQRKEHLMVEAGTGVGKSFAYLVPAIRAAVADEECRVVVSTHTISLQEQLVRKDIPFLHEVMPTAFTARLVKGRSNYISLRRLKVAQQRSTALLADYHETKQLDDIAQWARVTDDGSKSDLRFRPAPTVWELIQSDSDNCLGKKCKEFEKCFFFKARQNLAKTDVLVVNHALFFTDLALRGLGVKHSLLPDYQVVIFDEAHNLEDVAADHLGLQVTRGQADFFLNRLLHEKQGQSRGLLATLGDNDTLDQVYKTRAAVERFFGAIHAWRLEQQRGERGFGGDTLRIRHAGLVEDCLSGELVKLTGCIDRIAEGIDRDEERIEYEAAAKRCETLADAIRTWLGQTLEGQVYWIEGSGERGRRLTLASAPIDVSGVLRDLLFDKVPTVVLTSATLSIGGAKGFEHFKSRLGFPDDPTLQLGSPFNYREQVELHLFRRMPDPGQAPAAFEDACQQKIREYVQKTRGRAFVLFTSNQTMQRMANKLRGPLTDMGLELLCQGEGLATSHLLERFRQAEAAVLFGVDTFWQGVDVQGEALSNVIITRLPFFPPDRPIIQARTEAIDSAGGHSFFDYQVPQAIIKFKQGFGRLIRTRNDRGLAVVLDPRVLTKPYGRSFLDALPSCRKFIDGVEIADDDGAE